MFETLLRGNLFIVDNKEADLMYKYVEKKLTKQEMAHLKKRNLWPFNFLVKRLYSKETRKQHRKVFEELSRFSHPSIMSVFKDLDYSQSEVEDCLNFILCLVYGNIQMLSEGFFDFLDPSFKKKH